MTGHSQRGEASADRGRDRAAHSAAWLIIGIRMMR